MASAFNPFGPLSSTELYLHKTKIHGNSESESDINKTETTSPSPPTSLNPSLLSKAPRLANFTSPRPGLAEPPTSMLLRWGPLGNLLLLMFCGVDLQSRDTSLLGMLLEMMLMASTSTFLIIFSPWIILLCRVLSWKLSFGKLSLRIILLHILDPDHLFC